MSSIPRYTCRDGTQILHSILRSNAVQEFGLYYIKDMMQLQLLSNESALYVFFFGLFIPLLSIQIYLIQTVNFLNMSVAIIDFKPTVNTGKLRCILMVVGIILKFLLPEYRLVVEISNNKLYAFLLENVLSVLNLILVFVVTMKKRKINENTLGIIIHSWLSTASFLIFQIAHCIFYIERLTKPYNIDIYTFSAYYFVFFWIVSAYITNCKFIRKYIDRETIENPYVETEMEEVSDTAQQKF
ncbi:hypothetical protein CAEBREN_02311 [Caenorhabditis brenneri]|uniref:Uncharacterized protein n=1 Tax=Caenorhabditis brenneri TaxID=135651 RepID=G0MC45_CAEBE|nr:hypothetical protein CAEBREN_02311 [Caenorhabditis brenneri]